MNRWWLDLAQGHSQPTPGGTGVPFQFIAPHLRKRPSLWALGSIVGNSVPQSITSFKRAQWWASSVVGVGGTLQEGQAGVSMWWEDTGGAHPATGEAQERPLYSETRAAQLLPAPRLQPWPSPPAADCLHPGRCPKSPWAGAAWGNVALCRPLHGVCTLPNPSLLGLSQPQVPSRTNNSHSRLASQSAVSFHVLFGARQEGLQLQGQHSWGTGELRRGPRALNCFTVYTNRRYGYREGTSF